jgi:tetratricopeptide (TPR) repeat protein
MKVQALTVILLFSLIGYATAEPGIYLGLNGGMSTPVLPGYNQAVSENNSNNKNHNIKPDMPKFNFSVMPEIEVGYGLIVDPVISALYIKTGCALVYEKGATTRWPDGSVAQKLNGNFTALSVLAGFKRYTPEMLGITRPFFGMEAGAYIPFFPYMEEKCFQNTGETLSWTQKTWAGAIPAAGAEAGLEIRINESIGFTIKGGYRYARGPVDVNIKDKLNQAVSNGSDILDYTGGYAMAGIVIGSFESAPGKQTPETGLKDSGNYQFSGLAEETYNEGVKFFEKSLYPAAQEKFNEALNIAPDNPQIQSYLERIKILLSSDTNAKKLNLILKNAKSALENGKISYAYGLFGDAEKIDPKNETAAGELYAMEATAKLHYANGSDLYKNRKYADAEKEIKIACEYSPDDSNYKKLLNSIKMDKGNKSKVDVLFNKGVDYYHSGDYENAAKSWQALLEITPGDKEAEQDLANARQMLEKQKTDSAEKSKQSYAEASELYGQGKIDEARNKCEYALRLDPENKEALQLIKKIKSDGEKKELILDKRD